MKISHLKAGGHSNRVFGLDMLRAFAILCVVYEHSYYMTNRAIPEAIYNLPVFDGVTMFFVLSGFLIGRILLRSFVNEDFTGKTLLEFWVRRWCRTLPNYFLVLIILIAVIYMNGSPLPDDLFQYFIFMQNFASPHPKFYSEAWSLTIEEWFYMITPILFYISAKLWKVERCNLVLLWIAAIICTDTVFRMYRFEHYHYLTMVDWDMALRKQVVTRLDSLMFGVLGAYVSLYRVDLWGKGNSYLLFMIGISILLFDKFIYYNIHSIFYVAYFRLTLSSIGTLLLLPKLSSFKREGGWIVNIITWISLVSYSMYLLNFTPIQKILIPAVMHELAFINLGFEQHIFLTKYILFWFFTFACSFLLYQYFERPMTTLRDRFHIQGQPVLTAFTNNQMLTNAK
jgi:peptidoglycan/LPS O-acetylase OafA/YrhL